MREPTHPGEVVHGCESEDDTLSVELDEAMPGKVLVSMSEEGEFVGGFYLHPSMIREFGQALIYYADHANYWVEVDE